MHVIVLNDNNIVLFVGSKGVGKTTLSSKYKNEEEETLKHHKLEIVDVGESSNKYFNSKMNHICHK